MRTNLERWEFLWARLALAGDAALWHERLVAAYAEEGRAYHGLTHLEECLEVFDFVSGNAVIHGPDVLEMALWFHDAVYDSRRSDNEERSADWAVEALGDGELGREVSRCTLLTKGHEPGTGLDDGWLLDIDLSIFGRSWNRVSEYERQIRSEYDWVDEATYRTKRREILEAFLARPHIYLTDLFRDRFEKTARENLARLIEAL